MPRKDSSRDPYERIWERLATISGTLRALSQPDRSAVPAILKKAANDFSTDEFRIPPQRLTDTGIDRASPAGCAKLAANNLDLLVTERPDIAELSAERQASVRRAITRLVPLVVEFESQFKLPFDVSEKLRLARNTFVLNFG